MAQGKAWEKEKVIEALRPYFQLGYSVNKACKTTEVAQSTVQTWIDNDDELRLRIGAWQSQVSARSRQNIAKAILEGDLLLSKWWLENLEKDEFGKKLDITTDGEKIQGNSEIITLIDELKAIRERVGEENSERELQE